MRYVNGSINSTPQSENPLEARELDTIIRMRDPKTRDWIVFDRETGWRARFPSASRADVEMLRRFYQKKETAMRTNIRNQSEEPLVAGDRTIATAEQRERAAGNVEPKGRLPPDLVTEITGAVTDPGRYSGIGNETARRKRPGLKEKHPGRRHQR